LLFSTLSISVSYQAFADTFDSANDLDLQILAMVQQNEALNTAAFCAASCAPLYFPPPQQQQQFLPLPPSWSPLMAPMPIHMPLPVLAQSNSTANKAESTPSQAAAAASAGYYTCTSPQTSCDDSGSDSDRSRNNSNASSTDDCEFECSSSSNSSHNGAGVKRKRSKGGDDELSFSRQRNKEYSKNWRSKKRMQEEALKQELSELRAFKALVEGSLDMMSTHSTCSSSSGSSEHTFTYASPGFQRMLNIEPRHLVGSALTAVVYEPDIALVQCSFKQLAIDSSKPVDVTYRLKHPITGVLTVVESTLRTSEQGVLMVTRLR
jgi:PAS domain-containing protein